MRRRDLGELILLAAIWGASFLLMRIGAADFGPAALVWIRVAGACVVLLPLLMARGEVHALRDHWKPIFWVGLTNSAIPFALFTYALLTITGALASIFNAATPLFGALIAWVWLGDKLDRRRVAGIVIGFAGVFGLAWSKASFRADADSLRLGLALVSCLVAAASYGYSANFTKRYTSGVPPLALAAGSQLSAAAVWSLPAWWLWPASTPGVASWMAAGLLAFVCTGIAYILYFRLIANAGPANALTVTYLVPAFAVAWGAAVLGEAPTLAMIIGCGVILFGTALATGLLPRRRAALKPATNCSGVN